MPDDHLLVENDALGKAGVYFRPGKIIQAAKNLGVGVRAFEVTADYVQNYVQGGRILIKHQAVALRLADMATKIEAVRALLERAAAAVDDNAPDADALCNMAKLFASEEILKVAQHACGRAARRQRHDARFRHREAVARRRDLPAHGRHRRHFKFKIVKAMFPAHRRQICRAGACGRRAPCPRPLAGLTCTAGLPDLATLITDGEIRQRSSVATPLTPPAFNQPIPRPVPPNKDVQRPRSPRGQHRHPARRAAGAGRHPVEPGGDALRGAAAAGVPDRRHAGGRGRAGRHQVRRRAHDLHWSARSRSR